GLTSLFRSTPWTGLFASDNLVVWGRALSFLEDAPFMDAMRANAEDAGEEGVIWRTHTIAWAARRAMALGGDLVECGVYKGYTAAVAADLVAGEIGDRALWLYDAFQRVEGDAHQALPGLEAGLADRVRARFKDRAFVKVIEGYVPDSFAQGAPEQVAFLHIDMNNVAAESAALAYFWDRLVPGAAVVFDDYGWLGYIDQKRAHDAFAAERGHAILEMPTGQGLLIKT
ncbi:MAG: TylF/MycF/NovP-related O-methyltransferase, partial [Pseudomonadota bacterium]